MTIVSGDSTGKTTFWNGKQGTVIKVSLLSVKIRSTPFSHDRYHHDIYVFFLSLLLVPANTFISQNSYKNGNNWKGLQSK